MTPIRSLTLVLAGAAVLAASGCNNNCNDATPPVKQVPTSCTAVAGQALPVPVNTCPKCDQEPPACDVRAAGGGRFTLEPLSQVCDPQSCPIPDLNSCAASPLQCVLPATMLASLDTSPSQIYHLDIVTENGQVATRDFTFASSGQAGCSGMAAPF